MTDDEQQQIGQAIARAFETLSERLSKELEDALNQTARVMERAQKQQYEMMSILGKQAAAMEALADFVAKVRNDDVERHNLKYPLIYVTPKVPVNVAFWRRSSPYRSTSGRRRTSGMLAMRS